MSLRGLLLRRSGGIIVTAIAASFAGCGSSSGVLGGRVMVDGRPLANGILMVHAADGGVRSTPVLAGAYELEGVPLGPVRITIRSLPAPPMIAPPPTPGRDSGVPGTPAPTFLDLPESYADADHSGLTATVTRGRQRCDFDLSARQE